MDKQKEELVDAIRSKLRRRGSCDAVETKSSKRGCLELLAEERPSGQDEEAGLTCIHSMVSLIS